MYYPFLFLHPWFSLYSLFLAFQPLFHPLLFSASISPAIFSSLLSCPSFLSSHSLFYHHKIFSAFRFTSSLLFRQISPNFSFFSLYPQAFLCFQPPFPQPSSLFSLHFQNFSLFSLHFSNLPQISASIFPTLLFFRPPISPTLLPFQPPFPKPSSLSAAIYPTFHSFQLPFPQPSSLFSPHFRNRPLFSASIFSTVLSF